MSEYTEKAISLFKQGYNCSQSVVGAFADKVGLDEETALKISCGFGGGIGRMRSVCGAFSGAVMLAGMVNDADKKAEVYKEVQRLSEKFIEDNGSIICGELLGISKEKITSVPETRTEEYYKKRPCVKIVEDVAAMVEEMLFPQENCTD